MLVIDQLWHIPNDSGYMKYSSIPFYFFSLPLSNSGVKNYLFEGGCSRCGGGGSCDGPLSHVMFVITGNFLFFACIHKLGISFLILLGVRIGIDYFYSYIYCSMVKGRFVHIYELLITLLIGVCRLWEWRWCIKSLLIDWINVTQKVHNGRSKILNYSVHCLTFKYLVFGFFKYLHILL